MAMVLALVGVVACAPGAPAAPDGGGGRPSGEVVGFAASSLTDAFGEVGRQFQQAYPDVKVTFNFGASSQLRTQLEQGARADVFASADQAQMDAAKQASVVDGQDRVFARNRLTIITPRDNPAQIQALRDLANDGVKLVTTQPGVPIGQYTLDMLGKADQDPSYGGAFRARVERNVVSREDNVRQLVSKVQLGEADAGVCYTTDVTPQVRDQVNQVAVPDAFQTIANYPIALTKGNNPTAGQAVVDFVLSPTGQEILAQWGFQSGGS